MLKERIQEVFEFTKSESPYRKANKGWINQDIFLDLTPSSDTVKKTNEAAKVTLFWSPINSLLSNIFWIIILGSILVFTSVSFAKGRFDFNFFNNSSAIYSLKVEGNKALNISRSDDIGLTNSTIQKNIDTKNSDEKIEINSVENDLVKVDQKITNQKSEKKETLIKQSENHKDIKILKNNKSKSNFI